MKNSHTIIKAKQKAAQLLQANRLADGWDAYERISRQAPADHEVWLNMGAIAAMQGQYERAAAALRRALTLKPDLSQANVNMARVLMLKGSLQEALPYLQKYVSLQPADVDGYLQLGTLFEELKNFVAAEQVYREALLLGQKSAGIYTGLGRLLRIKGDYDEAREFCELALQLRPDAAMAWFELGQIHRGQHRFDEALASLEKMIALAPNERENYLLSLCYLYIEQERYEEALDHFKKVIAINPASVDAHWNHAMLLLLMGHYQEGWAEYEWRRHTWFWQRQMWTEEFVQPRWAGEPLAGRTILVYAEQGFGDTIQFGRYLPLLLAQGARVIFHCQPQLLALFRRIPGLQVEPKDYEKARQESFDYHLPLMSLPHVMGATVPAIPAAVPYLQPDPSLVAAWRSRIDPRRFNVGLVWAGSVINPRNRWRSAALEQFAALAEIPGVSFYSLQKDAAVEDLKQFTGRWDVVDLSAELNDFDDTAAVIENLDLVISVDSAVAHLAGALARPVWTLIYFPIEWRWRVGRDDTPWYPTMRLFRQSGDDPRWPPVMERVAAALRELVSAQERGRG